MYIIENKTVDQKGLPVLLPLRICISPLTEEAEHFERSTLCWSWACLPFWKLSWGTSVVVTTHCVQGNVCLADPPVDSGFLEGMLLSDPEAASLSKQRCMQKGEEALDSLSPLGEWSKLLRSCCLVASWPMLPDDLPEKSVAQEWLPWVSNSFIVCVMGSKGLGFFFHWQWPPSPKAGTQGDGSQIPWIKWYPQDRFFWHGPPT